jgi:hypothetical protein
MTRSLLERAAKAAGLKLEVNTKDYAVETLGYLAVTYVGGGLQFIPWNPVDDDGDALRLAVKLNFVIDADNDSKVTEVYYDCCRDLCKYERWDGDKAAATRLAIVRAAASMVKE